MWNFHAYTKKGKRISGLYKPSFLLLVAIFLAVLTLSFALVSCGSERIAQPNDSNDQIREEAQPEQENRQKLGRIMTHRNPIEGEIAEPINAVILGNIEEMAEEGEETWFLVRVAEFRCEGVEEGQIRVSPGSLLSVRMHIPEDIEKLSIGDKAEIYAMVAKSLEGPIVVGKGYRKTD